MPMTDGTPSMKKNALGFKDNAVTKKVRIDKCVDSKSSSVWRRYF